MSAYTTNHTNTQNELLMKNLMDFYANKNNLHKMMRIINVESRISLRIIDWFVTNFAKKYYTVYELNSKNENANVFYDETTRFKVYNDYKLKLKAYSKRRFDPFCRWERISIPYDDEKYMETTIGQLNFFKWAIENNIIEYIDKYYEHIESDMNSRNSTSKRKYSLKQSKEKTDLSEVDISEDYNDDENSNEITLFTNNNGGKTRKKREELSVSACKCIKKETVKIIVKFN